MVKTIEIIDEGKERYIIKSDCDCLGRRYDNNAEKVKIIKPGNEINNNCTMVVSYADRIIDHIIVGDEPVYITSNLSQYCDVDISFSFSNDTGYIKNSEIKNFYFAKSLKPDGFVPAEPEQKENIDTIINNGFASVQLDGNYLKFFNMSGKVVGLVDLSNFNGGGSGEPTYEDKVVGEILEMLSSNASVSSETLEFFNDTSIDNEILEVTNG